MGECFYRWLYYMVRDGYYYWEVEWEWVSWGWDSMCSLVWWCWSEVIE